MQIVSLPELPNDSRIDDATEVARYLDESPVLIIAVGSEIDEVDGSKGPVVPIGMASDGDFVWPISLGYYVRNYAVPPPSELLSKIRALEYRPPEVADSEVEALRAELLESEEEDDSADEAESLAGLNIIEDPFAPPDK